MRIIFTHIPLAKTQLYRDALLQGRLENTVCVAIRKGNEYWYIHDNPPTDKGRFKSEHCYLLPVHLGIFVNLSEP